MAPHAQELGALWLARVEHHCGTPPIQPSIPC